MSVRPKIRTSVLAAALAVPAAAVLAAPAQAAPSDCTTETTRVYVKPNVSRTTATVKCASGTGQYRALMKCASHVKPGGYLVMTLQGAWAAAGPGTSSTVMCYGISMSGVTYESA